MSSLHLKNYFKLLKTDNTVNNFKRTQGRVTSYSKKMVWIIKKNTIETYDDFYCLNCHHCFRTEN